MHLTIIKLLVFFGGVFSFGYIIYTILIKFSKNLGIRNTDENIIRWSSEQKPSLGGIGFYIAFLISTASFFLVFNNNFSEINIQLRGLIFASSLAFLMGLADDAYNTRPIAKLASQIICAIILIYHQLYFPFFESEWLNYSITIFWVVGLMNSLNMLDNMDGITTLISVSICLHFLLLNFLFLQNVNVFTFITIGLLGILLSFFLFNKHPSKIFMGDTGSQFLGLTLAGLSIIYFTNTTEYTVTTNKYIYILILISAFIIPITDTTTVFINRIRNGKSPFIGGKDHTTHHLSYKGYSDNKIAIILFLLSLTGNSLSFLLNFYQKEQLLELIVLNSAFCFFIFFYLFIPTIRKKEQ